MPRKLPPASPALLAIVARHRDSLTHPIRPDLKLRRTPSLVRRIAEDDKKEILVAGRDEVVFSSRSFAALDELVQLWYHDKKRRWKTLRWAT